MSVFPYKVDSPTALALYLKDGWSPLCYQKIPPAIPWVTAPKCWAVLKYLMLQTGGDSAQWQAAAAPALLRDWAEGVPVGPSQTIMHGIHSSL